MSGREEEPWKIVKPWVLTECVKAGMMRGSTADRRWGRQGRELRSSFSGNSLLPTYIVGRGENAGNSDTPYAY
jgi:hypothetical protein